MSLPPALLRLRAEERSLFTLVLFVRAQERLRVASALRLWHTLTQIRTQVTSPHMARIRLQWWADTVCALKMEGASPALADYTLNWGCAEKLVEAVMAPLLEAPENLQALQVAVTAEAQALAQLLADDPPPGGEDVLGALCRARFLGQGAVLRGDMRDWFAPAYAAANLSEFDAPRAPHPPVAPWPQLARLAVEWGQQKVPGPLPFLPLQLVADALYKPRIVRQHAPANRVKD